MRSVIVTAILMVAASLLAADKAEPAAAEAALARVAKKLEKKVTIAVPRETLEGTLKLLAEQTGVPIEIVGKDLMLEGLTKNQSFALEMREQPAADVLLAILRKASTDGKLVYIVGPPTADKVDVIQVTTRAMATKRGDRLPAALTK